MKRETFQEYMTKMNPNWQQLPLETIEKAKGLFELKNYYEDRGKTLMEKQFSSSAGIDYSTDYEKNNAKLGQIYEQLNETVSISNTNEHINTNIRAM